jgi:hypothetical protein
LWTSVETTELFVLQHSTVGYSRYISCSGFLRFLVSELKLTVDWEITWDGVPRCSPLCVSAVVNKWLCGWLCSRVTYWTTLRFYRHETKGLGCQGNKGITRCSFTLRPLSPRYTMESLRAALDKEKNSRRADAAPSVFSKHPFFLSFLLNFRSVFPPYFFIPFNFPSVQQERKLRSTHTVLEEPQRPQPHTARKHFHPQSPPILILSQPSKCPFFLSLYYSVRISYIPIQATYLAHRNLFSAVSVQRGTWHEASCHAPASAASCKTSGSRSASISRSDIADTWPDGWLPGRLIVAAEACNKQQRGPVVRQQDSAAWPLASKGTGTETHCSCNGNYVHHPF